MEYALGASSAPHPQLVANDMVATVDDPELGHDHAGRRADPPVRHAGRDPGPAARSRASTTTRSSASSATPTPRSRRSAGARLMHALEGVRLIDFGQYLAGPFGPMVIGDLGADVIKVEPVTGDGMRMASKPFFGCQRGKRDIALDLKNAARAARSRSSSSSAADIVHHNMTAGVATQARHRLRGLQAREARHRLLQHVGVRARGSARALRRARPAVPGVGRARVRVGPGARRQHAALLPLRHDATRPTRCCRSSAASPRCTTSARTGEGQELWTSLLDGGAMFASDALLVDGDAGAAAAPRPGPDRHRRVLPPVPRRRTTAGSRSPRSKDATWAALCRGARRARARRRRPLRDARRRARSTGGSSRRCSNRASRRRTAIQWTRALDDAGVPERGPVRHQGGRARAVRRRQRAARPRRRVRPPAPRPHAPVRRRSSTSRRRPASIARPAAARRRAHHRDPRVARLRRRRDATRSRPKASSTGPTTTTPGRSDRPFHANRRRETTAAVVVSRRFRGRGRRWRGSRSSYLSTLPLALSGSASTTSTWRGTL